jgi:lipoyl(octanoyl) transferase
MRSNINPKFSGGGAVEWRIAEALVPYLGAVDEMERRVGEVRAGRAGELVWLLEHPPLYTAGTSADPAELLDPDRLPIYASGRGGRYTYHGPGQRVGYVVSDLRQRGRDVHRHVHNLESWIIETLARFGVRGERRPGRVGIWVDRGAGRDDKIAAIGVRVRHWIAYHGVALNVAPDLQEYDGIVPCGVTGHGITSLRALGINAAMGDVDAALQAAFPIAFAATASG